MSFHLGSQNNSSKLYLGTQEIQKLYLGDKQVWGMVGEENVSETEIMTRGLCINSSQETYYALGMPFLNLALVAQISVPGTPNLRHDERQLSLDITTRMPSVLPSGRNELRFTWSIKTMHRASHPIWGTYRVEFHGLTIGAGANEFAISWGSLTQTSNLSNGVYIVTLAHTGSEFTPYISITANTAGRTMPEGWYVSMVRTLDASGDPVDNLARYEGTGDYSALDDLDARRHFTPEFLALYNDWTPAYLRFIKMCNTETGPHVDVGDYTPVTAQNYRGGFEVPIELAVSLCNYLECGCWIGMWARASDALIDSVAIYVRDNLDSGLSAYFEYYNEVWNNGYKLIAASRGQGIIDYGSPTAGTGTVSIDGWAALNADKKKIVGTGTNFSNLFGPSLADIIIVDGVAMQIDTGATITDTEMSLLYTPPCAFEGATWYAHEGGIADYYLDGAADAIANLHARTAAVFSEQRSRLVNVIGASMFQSYFESLLSPPNSATDIAINADAVALNVYYGTPFFENSTAYVTGGGTALRTAFATLSQSEANVAFRDLIIRQECTIEGITYTVEKGVPDLAERMAYHRALAQMTGLKLLAYEGGNHIIHKDIQWDNTGQRDAVFALMVGFFESVEAKTAMEEWANLARIYQDGPLMQFPLLDEWGKIFGVFSALPEYGYVGDNRTAVLAEYKSVARWWE